MSDTTPPVPPPAPDSQPTQIVPPAPTPYPQPMPYVQPNPYATGQPNPYPVAYGPATNTLSIVALILAFVVPLGGIICGHIALGQIKRTGERGHGLALAGTIVGYVFTAMILIFVLVYVVIIFVAIGVGATSGYSR